VVDGIVPPGGLLAGSVAPGQAVPEQPGRIRVEGEEPGVDPEARRVRLQAEVAAEEVPSFGTAETAAEEEEAEIAVGEIPRRRLVAVGLVPGEPQVVGARGWLVHDVLLARAVR